MAILCIILQSVTTSLAYRWKVAMKEVLGDRRLTGGFILLDTPDETATGVWIGVLVSCTVT